MHKLKVSIRNDAHKFHLRENNYHEFYLRENNYKNFEVFAYDASAIYSLLLDAVRQQSMVSIGDRDVMLCEFDGLLKDLPDTLRKFVGRYVYVVAKCLPYASAYTTYSSIVSSIVIGAVVNSSYSYHIALESGVDYRLITDTIIGSSKVGVKSGIALRSYNDANAYASKISMGNRDISFCEFDGQLVDLPDTLRQFMGRYVYIIAKCMSYTSGYMASSSIAMLGAVVRAIGASLYSYSMALSPRFGCKLTVDGVATSSKVGIKSGIALRFYNDANAYASSTSYTAKIAYRNHTDENKYGFVMDGSGHMIGRLEANESNSISETNINDNETRTYGVKRLSSFNGKLSELPQSLFDFCYRVV